ncbi:spermatogenesis-associated protein 4 isoform X1 [Podarcis raffonei]|uniref:spermatogenesis-associated protein 4 isoform X1 n=1 Tax=Podarcis raffonei TaxID=65483 RepID=UPI0023297809|nr:spermatogenesis-associated protein 4 isoform X1 [Podarcis raffonei]
MVLEGARKGKLPLLMSYSTSPRRAGLPRTVLRWLQSLDLSFSPTHFRRDFSNGYLIAEIFSWYYPEDIQMRSFENGTSLPVKLSNWSQLGKFFAKRNLHPIRELIDGTIHCKPGAAEIFLQDIYTMLTNRRIKHIQDEEIDFTDSNYQDKLPMVARSTASRAIKTNIKLTEIMVEPNIQKNRKKVNAIINMHMQRRQLEREQVPERFGIKKTLGERAIRRPSMIVPSVSTVKIQKEKSIPVPSVASTEIRGKTGVHFKTVQVKQAEMPFRCELNSGTLNHLKEL